MTTLGRAGSALVVIDVQNTILADAHNRDETIANIRASVEKARLASVPVIWVQHSDEEIIRGSHDWQLVDELSPLSDELTVEKHFRSCFVETNLGDLLAQGDIGHLFLCGAETNMCVRHTSHSALELGYDVTLIADAHTCTGFEWNGYVVDAARVIDEQNINLMSYQLPGRIARAVPVAEINFATRDVV
jgi:nicotinamidase-related amidase